MWSAKRMLQRPAKGAKGSLILVDLAPFRASDQEHDGLCVFHPDNDEPRQLTVQDMIYCCMYCPPGKA